MQKPGTQMTVGTPRGIIAPRYRGRTVPLFFFLILSLSSWGGKCFGKRFKKPIFSRYNKKKVEKLLGKSF